MSDEQITRKDLIYTGRTIKVFRAAFSDASGKQGEYSIVDHPGGVVVLPVHDDGSISLVRQWRRVIQQTILELPAGTLEVGEDPAVCAVRELAEETNLAAARWSSLGTAFTAPGFCNEVLHGYLAQGLASVSGQLDDDEKLVVERFSRADFERMIKSGTIIDAKTVTFFALAVARGLI